MQTLRDQLDRQSFRDWELIVDTDPSTPGQARNLGARGARGEWLVFFDDDVYLDNEKLLVDLVKALESVEKDSVVGTPCWIVPWANRFQKREFGESFRLQEKNGSQELLQTSWADSANGRCMAIHRETFETLGGFDGKLPSGEEPELLYRLCRQGGKVYLLMDHRVYYAPPEDFKVALKKTIWYEQGNARIVQKHPDSHHRLILKNRWHAAGYLLMRTLLLLPLCFIKISYHYRRPQFEWRPISAFLSYVGAWVYCLTWFSDPRESLA